MVSLHQSRFLLVGIGGLGTPMAMVLLAAGVARIRLVDNDVVDLSNLQRQLLFRTQDVGRKKVDAARDGLLRRGFAATQIDAIDTRFDHESAPALLKDIDVVVEGSDDLATKFVVNDACVAAGLPFVIAGVTGSSGQVFPIRPGHNACYRCLFETPPSNPGLTCANAGVLGTTCAQVAARQAEAAIALVTGRDPGSASLLSAGQFRPWRPRLRDDCSACAPLFPKPASQFEPASNNP